VTIHKPLDSASLFCTVKEKDTKSRMEVGLKTQMVPNAPFHA
jgi:hypothetical protein